MFDGFKYALRLLYKSPAYNLLLISLMTVGLAICLYMFSFVYSLVFKPLPFEGGDKIVYIGMQANGMRFAGGVADVDSVAILDQSQSFDESGLIGSYRGNITIEDKTYSHMAASVEPSVFELTSVSPIFGRAFNTQDAVESAPLAVLISYELWQRYYPNGKKVLGEVIKVNKDRATIIGVMPKEYSFPDHAQLWLPITRELLIRGDEEEWHNAAVAKLKEGVSISAANDDVKGIMKKLATEFPRTNYGMSAYVETFQKNYVGTNLMVGIWLILFSALFLLLITILNVSAMLLSKSLEYSRETAVRRAIGAPKFRLMVQMVWPSLIVSVVSGVLALLLTGWALQLTNLYFNDIDFAGAPYWLDFTFEPFIVYITLFVICMVAIVSGILPGLRACGETFNALLHQSNGGATNYYVSKFSRHLLKAEVGLSAFILTIALLMVVNINQSSISNDQYLKENMLTSMLSLPWDDYEEPELRRQYLTALKTKILALPEVQTVSFSSSLPGTEAWPSIVHARDKTTIAMPIYANTSYIGEELLQQTQIPLLAGRYFDERDDHTQPPVAIISKSLAKTLWQDEPVIGKKIVLDNFEDKPEALIVGLVDDVFHGISINHFARLGGVYVPVKQYNYTYYQILINYQGSGEGLVEKLDQLMFEVDPDVPQFLSMSYEKLLSIYSGSLEFSLQLFTLLAAISLLLTGAGIYGVSVNSINQKQRDIATRRALGATNQQVVSLFLRTTMWDQFIALVAGGLAATGFSYWQLQIFILEPKQMVINVVAVVIALLLVILGSVFVPLRKILKLSPAAHLRAD
ncbi:MAG: FtsX-like permease family protein [Psychromonas sp.]|nr:FtsX-like permease family protein [Alteromonadales bacterium]MCP5079202.1 FtsX-like permease family protein [Psychromonas sp.]